MFGDDARIYKDEKMTVYQFGFMLSASALSTFIITVLPNWALIPGKTLPDIERCITWMWQCAFAGRWPLTDHLGRDITLEHGERRFALKGEPLCKGEPRFRIAMAAFKADLAFEMQTFKFETYNQNQMCRECHAHKTDPGMLYTQLGPTAPWRQRVRTTSAYVCNRAETLPAFVLIPGWCLEIHRYDLMHVVFLGLALHLVGSCIMDLAERGFWAGPNLRSQLVRAWLDLRAWVRRHGLQCSQSRFTPGSLGRGSKKSAYAEIKSKAHNCRVMVSWLADILYIARDRYGVDSQRLAATTWALSDFCWCLDNFKHWKLSEGVARRMYERGHTFLQLYQQLSRSALARRKSLYGARNVKCATISKLKRFRTQ